MSCTAASQPAGVRLMFLDSSSSLTEVKARGVPTLVVVAFVTVEASKIRRVTAD